MITSILFSFDTKFTIFSEFDSFCLLAEKQQEIELYSHSTMHIYRKLIFFRPIYFLPHPFPSCHHFSTRTLKNLISVLQCSVNLLMLRMVRPPIEENLNFSQESIGNFALESLPHVKAIIRNGHCFMCKIIQNSPSLINRTTQQLLFIHAMLCYIIQCYTRLRNSTLHYTILGNQIALESAVLYHTILYNTIPRYIILYNYVIS